MADSPNSGPACCILGLPCCPPGGLTVQGAQKMHLANKLQSVCSSLDSADAIQIVEGLLQEFDLVPSGVGKAIADGYARWITKSK